MTDRTDLAAVRAYFAVHKDALIRQYGAHGAGVGRSNQVQDSYAIVLYVDAAPAAAAANLAADGIPVEFVVSGGFKALGS